MRRIFYFIVILITLSGCKRSELTGGGANGEPTVSFTAAFAANPADSKSTETAFENGDRVGVYLTKRDLALKGSYNAMDNKLFEYFSAGDSLAGVPNSVFYPDKTTPVAVYAYYPFAANMTNALAVPFRVTSNLKSSDLCYASLPSAVPSATAQPLAFTHSLSKLTVNVDFTANNKIASITSITMLNILDSCYIDLSSGVVTTSLTHKSDITITPTQNFILPAQSLHSGDLIRVECKLKDGRVAEYIYRPTSSPLTLLASKKSEITLIVDNSHNIALSDKQIIEPWDEVTQKVDIESRVNNHFTLHWLLPNVNYGSSTSVELHVKDSRSGYLSSYAVSNLTTVSGNDELRASYTFDLLHPFDLSYPYTIEAVEFKDAAGVTIQTCKAIIAAVIYRCGDLTIGLRQDNVLDITTGTITEWNGENMGGTISGGGVANAFNLTMYEPLYDYSAIKSVELVIDNAEYSFTNLAFDSKNNAMIAYASFALPDAGGRSPSAYPYSVTSITMFDSGGGVIYDGYCDIQVSGGGTVNLTIYNGGKVESTTSVTGWGSASQGGDAVYEGPLSSNLFSIVYCSGFATADDECNSVTKVVLTIGGNDVTLSGYSMKGSRFAATSVTAKDIIYAAGTRPAMYPYSITAVKLYNDKGLIETGIPASAITIYYSGAVQLQIMK